MKLNVLFTVNRCKTNSKGLCSITCRLTFQGRRKQFSTGLFVRPDNWNSKAQMVHSSETDFDIINTQLSVFVNKLNKAYLSLQVNEINFDVYDIYNQYNGKPLKKERGVLEVYDLHSARIKKLIGIDIKEVTYTKYLESGKHLKDFIKYKYKQKDIKIKALRSSFVEQYVYFLKVEKKFQQSTLNKAVQRFRKVIKYAVAEDYLNKDPFMLYRPKTVRKSVVFLKPDELKRLEETNFEIKRIQQIKDMFVFCCYTGLGFKEMSELMYKDITTEFDGELWINVHRQKTQKTYKVPLLPKALDVMKRYKNEGEFVLPSVSNTHFNAYLKEIADVVGLGINLTHHIARKTFASTVLLYNDIPMEIVSKLLGHTKLQTTQEHYGQVIQQRVSDVMNKIR